MTDKKVLLHACCGICSGYPISYLIDNGYQVTVYFTNDNLDTLAEYQRRLDAESTLCKYFDVPLIIQSYNHSKYTDYVKGLEQEKEGGKRCLKCFELRFRDTAQKALELDIKTITTSMIISPHKNFKALSEIGKTAADEYNLNFLAIDFKKKDGFLKTNRIAKQLQLYRQNYCGCEYAKGKG